MSASHGEAIEFPGCRDVSKPTDDREISVPISSRITFEEWCAANDMTEDEGHAYLATKLGWSSES